MTVYADATPPRAVGRVACLLFAGIGMSSLSCQVERVPLETWVIGGDEPPSPLLSGIQAGPGRQRPTIENPFAGNAYALEQGERYYSWFNCAGCHGAIGGGSMGPPLADEDWIYGAEPPNLLDSILRGRPNGMPSYGGAISHDVAWQVIAYVQSLGGIPADEPLSSAASNPDAQDDPRQGVGERAGE